MSCKKKREVGEEKLSYCYYNLFKETKLLEVLMVHPTLASIPRTAHGGEGVKFVLWI